MLCCDLENAPRSLGLILDIGLMGINTWCEFSDICLCISYIWCYNFENGSTSLVLVLSHVIVEIYIFGANLVILPQS